MASIYQQHREGHVEVFVLLRKVADIWSSGRLSHNSTLV